MKSFKSEAVDLVIIELEDLMRTHGKHLMKTDTIFRLCQNHIDLSDSSQERMELLEIGMRQVIQSRLYAHGYFSVHTGYFVNVSICNNLDYLRRVINGKDNAIMGKVDARNRLAELLGKAGQSEMIPGEYIPGEGTELIIMENKTADEIIADLEADAI